MNDAHHQIRLSGDPDFQDRLRRVRARLCRLRINEGRLGETAAFALHAATADEIVDIIKAGCCPASAPEAVAPNPISLEVQGDAAERLHDLRGQVIGLGRHRLNLRSIVHGAIWVASEKNDAFFQEVALLLKDEC
ncbi:MAG: hypothetical protein AAGC62_03025 [Pseudomonadota bacterium]